MSILYRVYRSSALALQASLYQPHARALILSYRSAEELVMLFPTQRDRGDEILKGSLFMAWLLMATTDAISRTPSEELLGVA